MIELNRNSLLAILKAMRFSEFFYVLIHQCLSALRYSNLINSATYGRTFLTRVLRQGDLISPYLLYLLNDYCVR